MRFDWQDILAFYVKKLIQWHLDNHIFHSTAWEEEGGSSFIMCSEVLSGEPAGVVEPSESALEPVDLAWGVGDVLPPESPSFGWMPLYLWGDLCPLMVITVSWVNWVKWCSWLTLRFLGGRLSSHDTLLFDGEVAVGEGKFGGGWEFLVRGGGDTVVDVAPEGRAVSQAGVVEQGGADLVQNLLHD